MGNREIFDRISSQYDTPDRMEIAGITVRQIRKYLSDSRKKTAIDFGCGTGLVGLPLAGEFRSVLLIDASQNMEKCVREKIERGHIPNADVRSVDLETEQGNITPADYVIAVQVLLHIKDTRAILSKLYTLLKPGGHLLLIDFEQNSAVVSDMVHNGFAQGELAEMLKAAGFQVNAYEPFYRGEKIFMGQDAVLFILDACKEQGEQHPAQRRESAGA